MKPCGLLRGIIKVLLVIHENYGYQSSQYD